MLKKEGAIQKKFMRFKQLADQSLFRAEKTELSDELHNAEKRLDILRGVLSSLVKRISASLQAPGVTDLEKRLKKMPASSMEATLNESSVAVGDGLLCDVLTQAAQATHCVMKEQQQMEENIEKNILPYFQALLDTDIPAIKKTKQTLSKLTLDMDAIKSRQLAASKQNSDHPSSSNQSKSTSLSNDYEDAANKVTTCKDQYTTELFTFLAREAEICEKIVEWMEAQSIFHALCKSSLENYIPEMLCSIASHSVRPVYGTPLEEHLEGTNREIALVIETCVSFLFENCMDEEGLFRIAPPASKLRKIKAAFNAGKQREMADLDAHVVAGALKLYIRELPEPLLTFSLFDNFIQCVGIKDRNDRLRELWNLIDQLPKANFDNTRHLIKFLAELSKNSAVNKMTPSNIAIVFGPNLLYSQSSDDGQNLAVSSVQNAVVEMLVENENYFFPGDHNIVDLDHISNSSLELSSFGSPIPKVNTSSLKDFGENGQSHVSSLETTAVPNNVTSPQASITSLDSISNLSSPQPPRRNKKLAPKPPVQSPGVMKRSESLRKPNDAPPISRPTNPPPPCPSTPTMAPTTKFDQASLPLIVTDSSPISSQSSLIGNANSLLPMPMGMSSSVNRRRPSLDEGSRESSPKPFVPGHNRARSDFTQMKSKVPPPIPNRVNSVSTNHNYVSPAMLRKASNQSPNSTGGVTFDVDSLASDASAQKVANRDRLASNDDATLL